MDKLQFLPFFYLDSEALRLMTGLKSKETIIKRLHELGVPIHGTGRNQQIYTHEYFEALENEGKNCSYIAKGSFRI